MVVYYFFDVRWFDLSFDADQGIVASIGCQDYQFADDVFVNTYHYFRAVALFVGIDHCFVIRVFQFLDSSAEIVFDGIAAFLERKDFDAFTPIVSVNRLLIFIRNGPTVTWVTFFAWQSR